MSSMGKSIGKLLIIIAALGLFGAIAIFGIGAKKSGSASDIKLGLDLEGGVSITYETVKDNPTGKEMDDTRYKMQKRVDNYSTEAAVYQEGTNRINVDIPGVKDANKVLQELGKAGAILFTDEAGKTVLEGSDITDATADIIKGNLGDEYVVVLTLNAAGTKKFGDATTANVGKRIAIIYDGETISNPVVNEPINDGSAQISGQATYKEAEELATTIRIGALPLELSELRSNVVGAKLGAEAIDTSLFAGLIGFILVILFMIAYYRIPGVAAAIALCIYAVLTVVLLNIFNVTLTLPGVAGILLSIGMAVDANCVIFSRIREEIAFGKTVRSSIKLGFHKALSAIIDGNVTTLIAAVVLWFLGTGTVKGFAQTLGLGIILSMFTALTVTRFILYTLYDLGLNKEKMYGIAKEMKPFPFIKHRKKFFALSATLLAIGIIFMFVYQSTKGSALVYGLDFVGGTSTEVTFPDDFDQSRNAEVEALVRDSIGDPNVEISRVEGENTLIIRTIELSLAQRNALEEKLVAQYNVDAELIQSESISGAISNEMKTDAILALIVATICMLLYVWVRFKNLSFGLASVIPLMHDVSVVFMVYAVARVAISSTFIACMLTIVGYSINATIVVFDRIRENRISKAKSDTLENIINKSISQTLSRSINTSLTTFIMVFVLFIFGVGSVKVFAGPLMAGIIVGCYSSVCLAGALFYILYNKFNKVKASK